MYRGALGGGRARTRYRAVLTLMPFVLLLAVVVLAQPETAAPGVAAAPSGTTEHTEHGSEGDSGDHGGMRMAQVSAGSYAARAPDLSPRGWRASGRSAKGRPASYAVDGRRGTAWRSQAKVRGPRVLVVDTRKVQPMSGLRYTPETVAGRRIGRYTVQVSTDGRRWRTMTSGVWANTRAAKTASFAAVDARYVRFSGTHVRGGQRAVAAAEIAVLGAELGPPLDRTGWSAAADSAEGGNAASNALDGNPATKWHSRWAADVLPLPHRLDIDTTSIKMLSALSYTPRQDASRNGNIGSYTIATSMNGTTWTTAATGTWADDQTTKTVSFTPRAARYVRLQNNAEAGGRGAYSSAAEVNLYGVATLDPAGWDATADSEQPGSPARAVLDGDVNSIWHTPWEPTSTPYPHTLTIDTHGRYRLTGLIYIPRQDPSSSGLVGRYRVEVSSDGATWTTAADGAWADDRVVKTTSFPAVTARYVRLVALSEAGDRGPWTTAAEIGLQGTQVDTGARGSWGPVTGLPIVPTSAILLPNDKVLTFSAFSDTGYDMTTPYTQVSILDVSKPGTTPGQRQISNTGHQMFCTGLSVLADGRVVITGGSGPSNTTIYDPRTDTFTAAPDMEVPRGYQTSVTLSNGRVFTIGGSWSGGLGSKGAEVLTADATSWSALPGADVDAILTDDPEGIYRQDNHAWLFAGPGGSVFHAGPSDQMNWFTTNGTGTTTAAGERGDAPDQMNGNAVMYDAGKILAVGGAPTYNYTDGTAGAWTIDITGGPGVDPVVTRQGSLSYARTFANSVVLPDGSVLTTGGQRHGINFTDTTATQVPELWTPESGRFRPLAREALPRTYHSFSLLLADGRVMSGGGGLCGTCTTNHPDVQILTPPYLLESDGSPRPRPAIKGVVPAVVRAGSRVRITTDRPVSSWAMVRTGSATHSINSDQRRFSVPATRVGSTNAYELQIPADRGTSVPGSYLLFALDAAGTPSVARWVRVPI